MAQHELHSKEARNFASTVRRLTDEGAEKLLEKIRWRSETEQVCPHCGSVRRHYRRHRRMRWRCADCGREFSVTTGTALHGHKLPFSAIVSVAHEFVASANGVSSLSLACRLGITPKTAQVALGRIREVTVNGMDVTPMKGVIHMDGIYVCGKPRKPNRRMRMPENALKIRFGKMKPADASKPWMSAGMTKKNWDKRRNKRVVVSLCESAGKGNGSGRVLAFVCSSENEKDALAIVKRFVEPGSIIMTDESSAFHSLSTVVEHYAVQHSKEHCDPDGVNCNLAEAWNSRFRRNEYGISHGFRPKYLQDYACEQAWRHTHRKSSQQARVTAVLSALLSAPKSAWWTGYWQGKHRQDEIGLDYFLRGA